MLQNGGLCGFRKFCRKNNFLEGDMPMVAERSEFKGKPMLVLKSGEDDKYPFSFGVGKAKKILEHLDDIRKFVEENQA
jgi:hypothetical protein